MKFLPYQNNVIILQSKVSRDNEHCSNCEQNFIIFQTRASHFRVAHVCFSQKYLMKFLPFQMNVIIFQYNASTQKMNTAVTSNNSVTYPE